MRSLYFMCVTLVLVNVSSTLRPVDDHNDSGTCAGEFRAGNSPFVPHRYSIYLDLNPEQKNFRGDVNIMGTMSNQTDLIVLHSVNLNVISVRVNGMDLEVTTWFLDETEGTLSITLPEEILDSNLDNLMVGVSYEGAFDEANGIVMQHYNEADKNRWIIFTHLEPIYARTVFPCIDLPKYKARFDISIKNPGKRLVVLSNMPRKSIDPKSVKFQTTPVMSTYLVSFVVCDYVPVKTGQRKYKTRPITTWVPKEMKGKFGATFVGSIVPQLLESLEAYTGNAYSLPKLDLFVVTGKPRISGMDSWGLIMYQVDSLMQGKRASANDQIKVIATIAHELAHNWFGNSVTVADWCGAWLQEALPTFLHGHISDKYSSDLDMANRVKWRARREVMNAECNFADSYGPLRDDNPRADVNRLFNSSSNFKGANLLYMIESMVTPEVFKTSLRSFINKYNNSYTTDDELWDIMEKEVGEGGVKNKLNAPTPLAEIVGTWVTKTSHPIVVLNRNKDGSLTVSQRKCNSNNTSGEWWIPISYTTSKEANFKYTKPRRWVSPMFTHDQTLNVTLRHNEWIILNIMGTGFYRVEYDKLSWKLFMDQLRADTAGDLKNAIIPPIHRAMLLEDSFHTSHTGEGMLKVFEIMEHVKHDTSEFVWEAMLGIGSFYEAFPEEEKSLFKKYVHFLLEDMFDRVANIAQWEKAYNYEVEVVNDRMLRGSVFELSSRMMLPALYDFSRDAILKVIYEKIDEKIFPPEVKSYIWCAAVSSGDQEIFEHVMIAYDSEEDIKKKAQIFERLKCSKTRTKILLDIILQSNVDQSKAVLIENVKEFLVSHWPAECEEILSFIDESKMLLVDDESELASAFRGYVDSPLRECRNKANELFQMNSTDEMKEDHREWKRAYGPEPLKWLKDHERQWF